MKNEVGGFAADEKRPPALFSRSACGGPELVSNPALLRS